MTQLTLFDDPTAAIEPDEVEKWADVPGYDSYQVSSFGQVRSRDRLGAARQRLKGRMVKPVADKDGYLYVRLGSRRHRLVHRLVLEVFVGPCPPRHAVLPRKRHQDR
jgi:hypothetical protein